MKYKKDPFVFEARTEIGLLIRERRKKLNLTQSEVSKALNMRHAQISIIESGKENYTIDKLIELCSYLDIKINLHYIPEHLQIRIRKKK